MSKIHSTAAAGFDTDANRYQRGRPDYPAGVDGWMRERLLLGSGKTVLDMGAGTGKFTRRLLTTGANAIAVEPVAAMRAKLTVDLPSIRVLDGNAEAIPLPDASVDAVVCAQAFHWFANASAVAEMCRVLKPGGVLGLIWNTRDDAVPWVRQAFAIADAYEGDVPRFRSGKWRDAFPAPGLVPLEELRLRHHHTGTPEIVLVDRILSISFIARLPQAERDSIAGQLRDIVASTPELTGKAEISVPYDTFAYSAKRL